MAAGRASDMTIEEVTTGFEGLYEVPEAARYLLLDIGHPETRRRVESRHLIRWIRLGLSHPDLVQIPGRQLLITFEDLISMRVIAFLRSLNYSFHRIRLAETALRRATGQLRPFATDDIWADVEGGFDIFGEISSDLLTATRHGQIAFKELLYENLISVHGLTFDERGVADSWRPSPGILMHPRVQFGRPCIDGTRVPTSDVAGMMLAGDSVEFLARSYSLTPAAIQKAIDWEGQLAAIT